MCKRIWKRIAQTACSAAAIGLLGITAAAQTDLPVTGRQDLVTGRINFVAGMTQAEPGEIVMYPICIQNNSANGFESVSLHLYLDEGLTPALKGDGSLLVKKAAGAEASDFAIQSFYDAGTNCVTIEAESGTTVTVNDVFLRVAVIVPESARPDYKMKLTVDQRTDEHSVQDDYVAVDGKLSVSEQAMTIPTATQATAAPAGTSAVSASASAVQTQPTSASVSFYIPTQPAPSPNGNAVPIGYNDASGYSGEGTDISGDSSATTSSSATTTAAGIDYNGSDYWNSTSYSDPFVTSTMFSDYYSSTGSLKTGDHGIALAVAGLFVSAAAALVVAKKKK